MTQTEKPGNEIQSIADLGYQVWQRRRALGMTQAQTAAHCGVGVRFLSDLENGKATVEAGRALMVLNQLGLSLTIQSVE